MADQPTSKLIVGITGGSGAAIAERLIEHSLTRFERIYVVITQTGEQVIRHELNAHDGFSLVRLVNKKLTVAESSVIKRFAFDDFFAPIASGTSAGTQMVVAPCSMGSLARMAYGMSTNLLERAADVMLKERRPLILIPREAPLSTLHLENLLKLSQFGATIIPPVPAFYQRPKHISEVVDFVVGKTLQCMGFEHDLFPPWNEMRI
jgi:4-hydroxy-3-polyprenylbenzoate decarboxylase